MIGDFRHMINFEAQTKTPDNMGGFSTSWKTVASSIAAAIWPVSAKEVIQAAQPVMIASHRIKIRYRANIKNSYRIKFGSRYFNIVSIINVNEKNEMLDILAKETT